LKHNTPLNGQNRENRCSVLAALLLAILGQATFSGPVVTSQGVWVDSRAIGGFNIYAQFPLDQVEELIDDLGHLAQDIQSALGIELGQRPVTVLLFDSQREYQQFLRREFPDAPYRRALYLERSGRAFVLAYRSRELATDLRHEATHALLHTALPMVPLWLDEGLAEYFEAPPGDRVFGHPYYKTVRFWARLGYVPSLNKLEQIARMEDMDGSAYRWSWAWVHFFIHGPVAARQELTDYLRTIQNYGVPGSLAQRTEARLGSLRTLFLEHFRK